MKILAFEASAKAAGVAVTSDGVLLGEAYANCGLTHSETLMPMCENLLRGLNLTLADIDCFALSAGPGSFTGLRIAAAAVKGMMLGGKKGCIPVSTLLALAHNVTLFDGIVCAVMDARCGQVYNAMFECENGKIERLCDDRAVSVSELHEELKKYSKKHIIFVGDGAELCYNTCLDIQNCRLAPENCRYQRASSVAFAAQGGVPEDENTLTLKYLRLPQAERERLARTEEKV